MRTNPRDQREIGVGKVQHRRAQPAKTVNGRPISTESKKKPPAAAKTVAGGSLGSPQKRSEGRGGHLARPPILVYVRGRLSKLARALLARRTAFADLVRRWRGL